MGFAFIIVILLLELVIIGFMIASMWKLFTKAGKPGWAAIVPIYNTIVLLEIAGKPWWWLFLFMIPIAGLIFAIITINQVAIAFGKTSGFTVGLILLPIVFFPILAWGDSVYNAPQKAIA